MAVYVFQIILFAQKTLIILDDLFSFSRKFDQKYKLSISTKNQTKKKDREQFTVISPC